MRRVNQKENDFAAAAVHLLDGQRVVGRLERCGWSDLLCCGHSDRQREQLALADRLLARLTLGMTFSLISTKKTIPISLCCLFHVVSIVLQLIHYEGTHLHVFLVHSFY